MNLREILGNYTNEDILYRLTDKEIQVICERLVTFYGLFKSVSSDKDRK